MTMTTSGWTLRRIQGPEVEPITLEQARAQCKIDADITDEDALLRVYIQAAREQVEDHCKITCCESTWRYTLREFPESDGPLALPRGPLIEVLGVTYQDYGGNRVAYETFVTSGDIMPPTIGPPYSSCWPFARCGSGSVVIEYRAGYPGVGSPPGAETVPAAMKRTMLALVSFWYENRDTKVLPEGWEDEIAQFRVYP
jgi:uncharacterized phiE125 gp8 family phage protein